MHTPDPAPRDPNAPRDPLRGLSPADLLAAGLADDTQPGAAAHAKAPPPPTPEELAPEFPALEIASLIGRGGMGAVYRARQRSLDRWVALKVLRSGLDADAGFAERFAREARALAQLNHPGIVTLYEFGRTPGGLFFILMELVDGVNLRQLLSAGRLSPREALAIVPPLCDALQYAHDRGLVHRDIKPENILVDRLGRVKIADFGIAKAIDTAEHPRTTSNPETRSAESAANASASLSGDLTQAGQLMGTPRYMAPEQSERPAAVDHRADLYALGVVFYQMLTGELPVAGQLEPPSRKVTLDVRLDAIVLRALERDPERRYAAANELKTQVETVAHTPPPVATASAAPPTPPTDSKHGKPRRPASLWVMAVITAVIDLSWIAAFVGGLTNIHPDTNLVVSWLVIGALAVDVAATAGVLRLIPFWRKAMLFFVLVAAFGLVAGTAKNVDDVLAQKDRDAGLLAMMAVGLACSTLLQALWLRWKWRLLHREDVRTLFTETAVRSKTWIEWALAATLIASAWLAVQLFGPMSPVETQKGADAIRSKLKADLAGRMNDENTPADTGSGMPADDFFPQSRLIGVELDLAAARTRYGPKHPVLIALEEKLHSLEARPVSLRDDTFGQLLLQRLPRLEARLAELSATRPGSHPAVVEQQARVDRARELLASVGMSPAVQASPNEELARRVVVRAKDNAPPATISVSVLGEVSRAGAYSLPHDGTLLEALAAAGSWRRGADLDRVSVLRFMPDGSSTLQEWQNLNAIIEGRVPNLVLGERSVVSVEAGATSTPPNSTARTPTRASPAKPEAEPNTSGTVVSVLGEATAPGVYTLREGATLLEALAAAGGTTGLGDTRKVAVLSGRPGEILVPRHYDLREIQAGKTPDPRLRDRDIILLPERIF